jgi:RimJ/RimL family protein N-acetyltransferase
VNPQATPVVETKRLSLRPFGDKHLTPRYVGWLNDPETMRWSEHRHKRQTLETCRSYRESMTEGGHLFWAIERHNEAPAHVGNIAAYLDRPNRLADVTILLGEPSARGVGFGEEAFGAVCRWLLQDAGFRKVTAGTLATNLPMRAIMRRIGMVEDGVRRRHYLVAGEEVDLVHGALFAPNSGES